MRILTLFSLLFVASCGFDRSGQSQAYEVAPFIDRPDLLVSFRHEVAIVKGDVWFFNDDGTPVLYHYVPVGVVADSNTYIVSIDYRPFSEMLDFLDESTGNDIKALIRAAERFCTSTGYVRKEDGAGIWVNAGGAALVEFCIPPNVELPPAYTLGDRVPR